jgi:hypothetical protein
MIFAASAATLLEQLHDVPDEVDSVLLVGQPGHPGACPEPRPPRLRERAGEGQVPDCGTRDARVRCELAQLAPGSAELIGFVKPKEL